MSEELIGLVLAYVFLIVLLLLAIIMGRLNWPLKTGLITVALLFYWATYHGWKDSQGWPSHSSVPEKFLFHFAVIEEPDSELNIEGEVFLWLTDLAENEMADVPRAYRLPYDQLTHAAIEEAMKQTQSGQPQIGQSTPRMEKPSDPKDKSALGQKGPKLTFTKLPDPALPEK